MFGEKKKVIWVCDKQGMLSLKALVVVAKNWKSEEKWHKI